MLHKLLCEETTKHIIAVLLNWTESSLCSASDDIRKRFLLKGSCVYFHLKQLALHLTYAFLVMFMHFLRLNASFWHALLCSLMLLILKMATVVMHILILNFTFYFNLFKLRLKLNRRLTLTLTHTCTQLKEIARKVCCLRWFRQLYII